MQTLQKIPLKYLDAAEKKASVYSDRITGKTEKTLVRLSRWEQKIKMLLDKTSPETAARLFSPDQLTFTTALKKYQEGKTITAGYKASYDQYRDELATQIKYLDNKKDLLEKKYVQPLANAHEKIAKLEADISNTEAMQQFIQERKKELITSALKHIGKSKYLQKINKESFYYAETLRNYKELFRDKKKAEAEALKLLSNLPAFKKFMRENSMLASLFRLPGNNASAQSLAGLQTRASVNSLIQDRITSGGPNARDVMQQNMEAAQAQLSGLKDKLLKSGKVGGDEDLPAFKPNMQKTKTFLQRLEYGFNFQAVKTQALLPGGADLGLSIGYMLDAKCVVGVGVNYKLGLGSINRIRFTSEGIGLRSFIDIRIIKNIWASGGGELNYHSAFRSMVVLGDPDAWQESALAGVSKTYSIGKKRKGKVQLLYDFLWREQQPTRQALVFRMGYNF